MLTAIANPISRSALRYSTGWLRLLPLVPAVIVEADRGAAGRPARIALVALCYAMPLAAAYVLESEHNGQLDQMRLSGQTPAQLLNAAIQVSSLWIAIAIVSLAWMFAAGEANANAILGIIAIAGIPTTLAAITCAAPLVRQVVDPRVGVAASCVFSAAIGAATGDLLRSGPWIKQFSIMIAIEAILLARYVPRIPTRLAHAPVARSSRRWSLHVPAFGWLYRWPGFYRGLSLSSSGVTLIALFVPPIFVVRWLIGRPPGAPAIAIGLPALVIGAIAISLICREDATTGRLDIVRLSPRAATFAALETIAGLWAPFVIAAAVITLAMMTIAPIEPLFTSLTLAAVVLVAPLPLIEGWTRAWPMMTTLPIIVALVFMRGIGITSPLAVVAACWLAVVRVSRDPNGSLLPNWASAGVVALICIDGARFDLAGLDPMIVIQFAVLCVFLLAPLLIHAETGWLQPLLQGSLLFAFGITIALQSRRVWADSLWAGPIPAIAWWVAYRLRLIYPQRPAMQGTIRFFVLMIFAQVSARSLRSIPEALDLNDARVALATAIAFAALAEIGYRVTTARPRRPAAATLPS